MNTEFEQTLLIVDDSVENLTIVSEFFKNQYNIKVAKSGDQALKIARSGKPPDLILLDIIMPEPDGYEVARRLKRDTRTRDIPIIFLTSQRDTESIAEGFRIGAQDYVVKPFNVTELRARVETHLELKRKREALSTINKNLERIVRERTRELEEANQRLLGLDKAKSRFLSLISHEMNTPVAVLLGYTEVLEEELQTSVYGKYIREIKEAVGRLQKFSDKALLITLLQTEEYKLHKRHPVTLSELVHNAIDVNDAFIKEKRLSVDLDVNSSADVKVDAKLIQIVINGILENAARFSPDAGKLRCFPN